METASIRAVLFAKDLDNVATFYSEALGLRCGRRDEYHAVLQRDGFELIVQQIPRPVSAGIEIAEPPVRREGGAIRLDFPVDSVERSRSLARSLGGGIDETPPPWAERDSNFYLGYDPEGNVFGVSEIPRRSAKAS